ncbi:MAG: GTP-binding protein [Pseudomonadota bacterium]
MSAKSPLPVTILNGFLGAGKTTLLQNLLMQAREMPELRLAVLVNEMSTLDVDSRILGTTEILSTSDPLFASIAAGSISSPEGLRKFQFAIQQFRKADASHIIIETSGSAHPWPLLEAIRGSRHIRLHGFLSIVDTVTLMQDYDCGRAIVPAASHNLASGKRGVENLLAEQIMFANRILLSKMDRVTEEGLQEVGEAIHPINRGADIMGMQWGNMKLADVIAMPPYDHKHVRQLGAELTQWDKQHGTTTMSSASEYAIDSIVISDARPFHPQRLWEVYNHFLGQEIYRSKGFFWLPSRDRHQLLWNQTAGNVGLAVLNYWKVAAIEDERVILQPEEREELQRQLADCHPDFGDRHCNLTVIGERDGLSTFEAALRECFCTNDEIAQWQAGVTFSDPWPDSET